MQMRVDLHQGTLRAGLVLLLGAGAASLLLAACDALDEMPESCDRCERDAGIGANVRPVPSATPRAATPTMQPAPQDAGAPASFAPGPCLVPLQAECACADGRRGARECIAGQPFGSCKCSGAPPAPDDRCLPGSAERCDCADGGEGYRVCHVAREAGDCICDAACPADEDAGCELPEPACADAEAFEGLCPGDPVRGAPVAAQEGSVYFLGTLQEGDCGSMVLQPFWPLLRPEYYGPFDCRLGDFRFGGAAEELFLIDPLKGVFWLSDAGQSSRALTPWCATSPTAFRFFKADPTVFQCGDEIYLSDGTSVATGIEQLVEITPRGLVLVTRSDPTGETLLMLDARGATVSSLTPGMDASGRFHVLAQAGSKRGLDAFVLWQRELEDHTFELLAYWLDEHERWHLIRRAPGNARALAHLLLPDGTIFRWEQDPENPIAERIQVLLRDGTEETAWLERDQEDILAHGSHELLLGPAVPKGNYVRKLDWP